MMKRHCDICDEIIPNDRSFVRMTKGQVNPKNCSNTYAIEEFDVCHNCYNAINFFKKEEDDNE